jgi:excisionase family DNA binding protein
MIPEGHAPVEEIVRSNRAAEEERRMAEEEKLLKSKDVAHILDCSPDDVHLLVHRGDLKGTKVGRFWRYRLEDVMEYKRKMEEVA